MRFISEKKRILRKKHGSIKHDNVERTKIGGYATSDGRVVLPEGISNRKFNPNNIEDFSTDTALFIIIHEYAHIFRGSNKYGAMFEEGFANAFATACIKNYKLKHQPIFRQRGVEPPVYNQASLDYRKAESQISSILYVLNQKGLDIQLLGEYIFGNRDVFKQKCTEIFGEEFEDYFEISSSQADQYYADYGNIKYNSEIKLVSMLANYIKNNGVSLSDYRRLDATMLCGRNSETLERAIVMAGNESIREDEQDIFEAFRRTIGRKENEEREFLERRKNDAREEVYKEYDLTGKSKEEIYEIVKKLCIRYSYARLSNLFRDLVFKAEIKKIVPNLEEFVKKSDELKDFSVPAEIIFADLDMEKLSYEGVSNCIFSTLEQFKQKELEKSIVRKFNGCDNKEDLLTRIEELKEHEGKFDLEELLPNYGDFIKFVDELRDQIPDTFSKETDWNYESLYGAFLKQYILMKEKGLADSREFEKECRKDLKRIHIQYKVLEHEEKFGGIKNNHDQLYMQLLESQQELEEEKREKANNQVQNEELVKRKEELEKKNVITRLLRSREIRELSHKITELGNSIHNNDINIEQIKSRIATLQGEIKDNEQQLIDLCGLKISDYASILVKCKLDNVTQDRLTEDAIEIQNEINGLNIPKQEQELENLYEKNGLERKTESVQQPIVRKRDDDEYCL